MLLQVVTLRALVSRQTIVTFYLVPTGRVQAEGAANRGLSESAIEAMGQGAAIIREVQSEIALERDDVQLAPDYSDLNMIYEEGQIYGDSYDQDYAIWSTDFWHLGHDSLQVNGDRIVDFEVGSDRLDLSELLILSGYEGSDPFGDGYITVVSSGQNSLEVLFDPDGAGAQPSIFGKIAIFV